MPLCIKGEAAAAGRARRHPPWHARACCRGRGPRPAAPCPPPAPRPSASPPRRTRTSRPSGRGPSPTPPEQQRPAVKSSRESQSLNDQSCYVRVEGRGRAKMQFCESLACNSKSNIFVLMSRIAPSGCRWTRGCGAHRTCISGMHQVTVTVPSRAASFDATSTSVVCLGACMHDFKRGVDTAFSQRHRTDLSSSTFIALPCADEEECSAMSGREALSDSQSQRESCSSGPN